jgi:hypothetical protein
VNGIDVSDDFVECSVVQNGNQEADTFSLTLPDTITTYIDLMDFYKEKVEVYLGYYMYRGGTQQKVVRKILTGYTDKKEPSITKPGGNLITLTGRNLVGRLIDATDTWAYINTTLEGIVKDQMSLIPISQRYNIPPGLNNYPYGSPQEGYGTTFEIDNGSIWETVSRLASDVGLSCTIDSNENFYFGVYEGQESYKFIFNFENKKIISATQEELRQENPVQGNVIDFKGNLSTPNSFHHKCQIIGHNDEGMEVVYGEAEYIPEYLKAGTGVKGATQLRTMKVINDLAIVPEMARVQAMMRLWENQRDLFTVQLASQYGIPYIQPGHIMGIENCEYPIFNRDFWIRNVTHSISKQNGYRMDLFGEVPPYGWTVTNIENEVGVIF